MHNTLSKMDDEDIGCERTRIIDEGNVVWVKTEPCAEELNDEFMVPEEYDALADEKPRTPATFLNNAPNPFEPQAVLCDIKQEEEIMITAEPEAVNIKTRRKLPKKGINRNWTEEDVKAATAAVREKKMTVYGASKYYKIPKATLQRLIKRNDDTSAFQMPTIGRPTILGDDLEHQLVQYCVEMERVFFGLTREDLKRTAFQFAVKKGINTPFKNEKAGRGWLDLFLRRHKHEISIRQSYEMSRARMLGFRKDSVDKFFSILSSEYDRYKFPAHRVWNVDETALSVVPSKLPKVVSLKGRKQVGALSAAERGCLITAVCSVSANGDYVPPLFVFPRKEENAALMKNAPSGSISTFHPSGWIQSNGYLQWLKHFISHTSPSKENPILLILDGHHTHTRDAEVMEMARENHVVIISLPPHSSQKLEPLDEAFMSPLKTHYCEAIRQFSNKNQRAISLYDVAECFNEAYTKASLPENGVNGFRKTGIYPLNKDVLQESDTVTHGVTLPIEDVPADVSKYDSSDASISLNNTSMDPLDSSSGSGSLSVEEISTMNSAPKFSSVPCKRTTQDDNTANAVAKVMSESSVPNARIRRSRKRKKSVTEVVSGPSVSADGDVEWKGIPNKVMVEVKAASSESRVSPDRVNCSCMFCGGQYVEGAQWIQCLECELWAHCKCTSAETNYYICDFCS